MLGSGSRKSRLSCSHRRRRRCRCCCGWCSELRGSESRLRPFPAAAMKWMFKEDHSLGRNPDTGRAVGAGAAGGPPPPLGPPWAGPGRAVAALWAGVSEVPVPRSAHRRRAAFGRTSRYQETEAAGTPEPGPRACVGRGGGRLGPGDRPLARQSSWCFSPRTQMRGIREDPSEISRPGSGEWTPRPFTSLSPLSSRTRDGARTIQELTT